MHVFLVSIYFSIVRYSANGVISFAFSVHLHVINDQ
jgi:hypothetical protein